MRTMTIRRTGATMTNSAMAWPSSPRSRRTASQPLVRYSWIGALLVADTVRSSQGMSAWARPVTVTWATSPGQRAGRHLWIRRACPGPVVAMKLVGRLGAGARRRAVAGGHLAALLGRGPARWLAWDHRAYWMPAMTSRKKTGRQTTNSANPDPSDVLWSRLRCASLARDPDCPLASPLSARPAPGRCFERRTPGTPGTAVWTTGVQGVWMLLAVAVSLVTTMPTMAMAATTTRAVTTTQEAISPRSSPTTGVSRAET